MCKAHLCVSFFLKRALFLQVWRLRPGGCGCWTVAGRALGCCCGGVLRGQCWDIVAAGPSGVHKLSRHTPRSRPLFLEFSSSVDLPVVLSLLYCLPSTKDFVLFVRSASRWSIGDEQGHRFLRFPAPRLLFNGAQFHSSLRRHAGSSRCNRSGGAVA